MRHEALTRSLETHALAPWQIYAMPRRWPDVPGMVFLPAAVAMFAEALFDRGAEVFSEVAGDIDFDAVPPGVAGEVGGIAACMADLLVSGAMTGHVQRLSGGEPVPIDRLEWTPERAREAVSRGLMSRRIEDGRTLPHWVHIGADEMELLLTIYGPGAHGDPAMDKAAMYDWLVDLVMGNLTAIARNEAPPTGDADARRLLAVLLPSTRPSLNSADRTKLVDGIAGWIRARLDRDPERKLTRKHVEAMVLEDFGAHATGRLAGDAWSAATSEAPYDRWSRPGPR